MKKRFVLAAVALSLLLLGYGILRPGGSAAMPMPQETPTPPTLTLDKGTAEIVSDLDGDEKVDPGDTIRYTITYSNTGEITATNLILLDYYDETFIESVANITSGGNDDENAITWELGALAGGEGDSVSYEATLKSIFPPGSVNIENMATIDSDETDPVSATSAVLVEGPNLTILKGRAETIVEDLGVAGVIDAGDTIKYVITYENIGDVDGTNVKVVDDYDEDFIANIANISPDGVNDGEIITWSLGTVEAGRKGEITYVAKLNDALDVATDVRNQVTIKGDGVEPVKAEAVVLVEVAPTPTPTPEPEEKGWATGIFAQESLIPGVLIGILAIVAMAILAYAGAIAKYSPDKTQNGELTRDRIALVREGVFLVFIVSAVIMLAIGQGIESDGAISILSAIVGYVFGRATGRAGSQPG